MAASAQEGAEFMTLSVDAYQTRVMAGLSFAYLCIFLVTVLCVRTSSRLDTLVQTLVWNRADGAPVVTKVGVYRAGRVALGFSLGEAIASWRGAPSSTPVPADWPLLSGSDRDARIGRLYDVMREAMRRGDWTRFGAAFDSLGLAVGKPPQ